MWKNSFDLDPDLLTLIFKLKLGVIKMYPHSENEFLLKVIQKLLREQTIQIFWLFMLFWQTWQ